MIGYTLTITGGDEVEADINARLAALQEAIGAQLVAFGKIATAEMIATHEFRNRTWRLEGSIDYQLRTLGLKTEGLQVFASMSYASQVEEGHPGPPPARPYPFFWPVFWTHEPELWVGLQAGVEAALGGTV